MPYTPGGYGLHVLLGCDNTDVVRALQRRTSVRHEICDQLTLLSEFQETHSKSFNVFYISSKENPANSLTRQQKGLCTDHALMVNAVQQAQLHVQFRT